MGILEDIEDDTDATMSCWARPMITPASALQSVARRSWRSSVQTRRGKIVTILPS
jgi:hypothetical protein